MKLHHHLAHVIYRWFWTFAYAAGIFYLSSRSWGGTPAIPHIDKVVHFFLYAGLGFLCAWSLRISITKRGTVFILLAACAAALYGALDEVHQMWVAGRSAEASDALVDAVGAFSGASLSSSLFHRAERSPLKVQGRASKESER